ncbi:MAG: class I SAM-dependent methyltransferase [Anaerolineales bacterium]|nr:class I SAM-dependent methyltransferase [Anaerolineales bacterium]
MEHTDHVELLRPANLSQGIYADFGAGSGAFTLALRELVGLDSTIYAIDKDRSSLKELEANHRARFNTTRNLILLKDDFSLSQSMPLLDGIVMANSLHFFKDKEKILRHVRAHLKPNGALLLVEYNVDVGNMWVPYPISFNVCRVLVKRVGFTEPKLLAKTPSRFLNEFYSAVAYREQK